MSRTRDANSQMESTILAAPLLLSQARWTSEDVARELGVSQSAVARTWRKHFVSIDLALDLPPSIEIVGFTCTLGHSFILAKSKTDTDIPKTLLEAQFMRSPRRIPLQTMLAAQVAVSPKRQSDDPVDLTNLHRNTDGHLFIFGTAKEVSGLTNEVTYKYVPESIWQGLLPYLIHSAHPTPAGNLHELHQQLIAWVHTKRKDFTWLASLERLPEPLSTTPRTTRLRSSQQVIADEAFEAIIELIWAGKLTAGDRITESSLARKLHTTRNQTRDALRTLASSGLVDHHPVRGVLVPSPKQSDITDIYAARRALGTEIIRRICESSHTDLAPIGDALNDLIRIGKTGNSYASGNADLHLQDVMAACSGMRNIPQMFEVLAKQLRLYITVLGMTYLYSIEAMVEDDVNLYRQLITRDQAGATATWNKKINDAVAFMTRHVNRK